jgi:ABC-type antimicrobial peptide transport system permease subunit
VRLVGALPVRKSVFQGAVLIPAAEFARRFPAEDGARLLLVDAPPARLGALRELLERELGRLGLELRTPAERLAEFYAVEHAYQGMFLALGGLGLLLGTAGLAVVVLRNVLERRAELALLAAVGFSRARIAALLGAEHLALFAAGLGAGMASALLAVLPALRAPGSRVPVGDLAGLALALLAAGAACVLVGAALGTRRPIVPALRRE